MAIGHWRVSGAARAVGYRTAIAAMASGLLTLLGVFGRPPLPDVPKVHVEFDHAWDLDGNSVSRHEWLERAQRVAAAHRP